MNDSSEQRYEGRPLLRLLDCYVLAVTGNNLAPEMEQKVAQTVRATFGGGPDWKATLMEVVKLPPNMDERIRALWRSQPAGVDPLEFALAVSDDNFLPMFDSAEGLADWPLRSACRSLWPLDATPFSCARAQPRPAGRAATGPLRTNPW